MTHAEMAIRIGMSRSLLTMIFNGRQPSNNAAKKLAHIIDAEWYQIVEMKGPEIEAAIRAALEQDNSEAA